MGLLNFEIVVEEEGKEKEKDPPEYVTFLTITISYMGKKTVVRILAKKILDKPYLHEINEFKDTKAIDILKKYEQKNICSIC
jgi:hypothetical protein